MGKTDYKGIDYSGRFSSVNRDVKTGIRYGVISQNEVLQAWADSSEPVYTYFCQGCGSELPKGADQKRCGKCHRAVNPDRDFDMQEPDGWLLDDGEYYATAGEDGDIFIIKSPYFTYAQFCSPCAPGAGYIMNELSTPDPDNRTYCFGHDFFDEGKAPYTVYSVETGKVVEPENIPPRG